MGESRPTPDPAELEREPLGSLRDIYVLGTDEGDWQRLLDALHSSTVDLRFTVDGVESPLPDRIADVRSLQERSAVALCVEPAGMRLGCYFFHPSEIEFDFDPRDIRSPELVERLERFVQSLSDLLGKPALITEENNPNHPIQRFDPRVPASHFAS